MIFGERIRLRAADREDLPRFTAWLNDPEVRTGVSMIMPLSLVEEEAWFEKLQQASPYERPLVIEVAEGDHWIPIGDCGYHAMDWRNRSAELGIFIGEKNYWNQGYGGEAMRLLLKHGFNVLNLDRIFLRVFSNNLRAIRCYEKIGFVHEGCFRQAEFQDGKYHDVMIMSVLRSEWNANQRDDAGK